MDKDDSREKFVTDVSHGSNNPNKLETNPSSNDKPIKQESIDTAWNVHGATNSDNDKEENKADAENIGIGMAEELDISGGVSHVKSAVTNLKGSARSVSTATGTLSSGAATLSAEGEVIPGPKRATHFSLNDSAATQDTIGFTPYVKALAKLICHKDTNTPLVISVNGEWGAGKASFMRLLESEVESIEKIQHEKKSFSKPLVNQVWFNAWKYDNQSDLWAALLQAITKQVESNTCGFTRFARRFSRLQNIRFYLSAFLFFTIMGIGWWFQSDLIVSSNLQGTGAFEIQSQLENTKLNANTSYIFNSVLALLPASVAGVLFYWLGLLSPLFSLVRRVKNPLGIDVNELINGKDLPEKIEGIRTFEKILEERFGDYLSDKGRLIIYIDDLDRCSPEHAVEIIEAVNVFLETDRCVFILGMDNKLIANSIELKYKEISKLFANQTKGDEGHQLSIKNNRSYGEFFLEKIIQIPISVPKMTSGETEKFARALMPKQKINSVQNEVNDQVNNNKNKNDGQQLEELNIPISEDIQNAFLSILPHLEANPRTIKRFYNMLTFAHFFYRANRDVLEEVNDVSLTLWFFLQYQYPQEIKKLRGLNKQVLDFNKIVIGVDDELPEVKEFFVRFSSNKKNAWVMENLEGKVGQFFPITRFFAI